MSRRDWVRLRERVRGMLIGFAVGDALGAPVAGLPADSPDGPPPIVDGFIRNTRHPYFASLGLGCVTENTRLLLDAARDYSLGTHDLLERRRESLASWATRIAQQPTTARWPGAVTLAGATTLARGAADRAASRPTVGAVYRCLPIAVVRANEELRDFVRREVELTHGHAECLEGSVVIAEILSHVLSGKSVKTAVDSAIESMSRTLNAPTLLALCQRARSVETPSSNLCTQFGTGALVAETIPLTIAIVLAYGTAFDNAILYGANAVKVSGYGNWDLATVDENGGNSDGIAALVGAIIGARLGVKGIGTRWSGVEEYDVLASLADALVQQRFNDEELNLLPFR